MALGMASKWPEQNQNHDQDLAGIKSRVSVARGFGCGHGPMRCGGGVLQVCR